MKFILASATAAGLTGFLAFSSLGLAQSDSTSSGSGSNETNATAASCTPLTASNRDVCCNAPNWNELIRSEDAAYCPSSGTNDTVRLGRDFPSSDGSDSNQLETGSGTDSTSTGAGNGGGGGNNAGGNNDGGNNNGGGSSNN